MLTLCSSCHISLLEGARIAGVTQDGRGTYIYTIESKLRRRDDDCVWMPFHEVRFRFQSFACIHEQFHVHRDEIALIAQTVPLPE